MKCPVCRAMYQGLGKGLGSKEDKGDREVGGDRGDILLSSPPTPPSLLCRRCGVDLSPLIRLHDQAIWYHRHAIQAFKAGDYQAATAWNHQALALHANHADFHALAGQLWALQGEFRQAIAAWKTAQQLNPQQPTANACLQSLIDL